MKPRLTISGRPSQRPVLLVDGDDGQHESVFGEVAAVADHELLHHFVQGAGIDAHAADLYVLGFTRSVVVDFQRIAGFQNERLFQARVAQMLRQLGVAWRAAGIRRASARNTCGRTRFSTSRSSSALP